jgi:hypothetical protein
MNISALAQLADRLISGDYPPSQVASRQHAHHGRVHHDNDSDDRGDRYTPSSPASGSQPAPSSVSLQLEQFSFSALNVAASAVAPSTGTPPATTAPAATKPAATTTPASTDPLQSVNSSLAAIGLSSPEIQAFDQFAHLIQQFSPAAFKDLANQINGLASQTAAPTSGSSALSSAAPGFQLTELSVNFSGIQESVTSPAQQQAGTATVEQLSAYQLQIQEVRVSLTDQSGQAAQLQVPQPAPAKAATASTTATA